MALAVILSPYGIIDTITGTLGGLLSRPIDFARELVRRAVDWVMEGISNVIGWVGGALDGAWAAIRGVQDFANSIFHRVEGLAISVWDRLTSWVGDRLGELRGMIAAAADGIRSWVGARLAEVRDLVDGARRWVTDHVWRPLWDQVTGLGDWVRKTVLPYLTGLVADLRGWATGMFDWVRDHALDLIRPWIDWAQRLLTVVDQVWDWLVWLARYPYSWFREQWRSLLHWGPREVVAGVMSVVDSEGDLIEDHLVRWLG